MKDQSKLPSQETITRTPFPKSKKIFVKGKLHPVEVAMREIETDDEIEIRNGSLRKEKFKITVYDTSGSYTDPGADVNVHVGLQPLRRAWILQRNDVDELEEFSSAYSNERLNDAKLNSIHFSN